MKKNKFLQQLRKESKGYHNLCERYKLIKLLIEDYNFAQIGYREDDLLLPISTHKKAEKLIKINAGKGTIELHDNGAYIMTMSFIEFQVHPLVAYFVQ